MKRFVPTGAPGVGKTTIIDRLRDRGRSVVVEAATDFNHTRLAAGVAQPWTETGFIDGILSLQRERLLGSDADVGVQFHDRSAFCTVALARYLDRPVTPALASEVERVADVFERQVFVVQPLGFITNTAIRRISYADSLRFAAIHEDVYREYGFDLVDVVAAGLKDRVAFIENFVDGD